MNADRMFTKWVCPTCTTIYAVERMRSTVDCRTCGGLLQPYEGWLEGEVRRLNTLLGNFELIPHCFAPDPLQGKGYEAGTSVNQINVSLDYPRNKHRQNAVRVGLSDVLAADGLLIVFDFERNGWSIMRSIWIERTDLQSDLPIAHNVEVCFIQAWTEAGK